MSASSFHATSEGNVDASASNSDRPERSQSIAGWVGSRTAKATCLSKNIEQQMQAHATSSSALVRKKKMAG